MNTTVAKGACVGYGTSLIDRNEVSLHMVELLAESVGTQVLIEMKSLHMVQLLTKFVGTRVLIGAYLYDRFP